MAVDELVCQSAAGRARLWAQSPLLNRDFWSIGIESWDEGSPWLTSQVPHRFQIFHLLQTHSGHKLTVFGPCAILLLLSGVRVCQAQIWPDGLEF